MFMSLFFEPVQVGKAHRQMNKIRSNRHHGVLSESDTMYTHKTTDKHQLASVLFVDARIVGK
jgi:hypothetical protein